jgi:REP element-mobilizing transposase RayT
MANTYTKLFYHIIFSPKGRANIISYDWKDELYTYITGITSNKNQTLISINGMPDHIHILIGTKPDCNLSDLVRDIKANSSRYINENKWVKGKFEWQQGFAAFTVGYSQVETVKQYIINQEEHHKANSFRKEYIDFLNQHDVEFKTEYLFEEVKCRT